MRVVLQIGDKIYQPVEQPGDIIQRSGTANTEVRQVDTAYGYGRTNSQVNYVTYHNQGYDWYSGSFSASFSLFDDFGVPRITADAKEMTFIVVYGTNERKVTYKLADLAKHSL